MAAAWPGQRDQQRALGGAGCSARKRCAHELDSHRFRGWGAEHVTNPMGEISSRQIKPEGLKGDRIPLGGVEQSGGALECDDLLHTAQAFVQRIDERITEIEIGAERLERLLRLGIDHDRDGAAMLAAPDRSAGHDSNCQDREQQNQRLQHGGRGVSPSFDQRGARGPCSRLLLPACRRRTGPRRLA